MRFKKVISLILAICMMISLLPQIAAETSESNSENSGMTVKYDFDQVPSGTADNAVASWYTFENTHNFFEHRTTTCKTRMSTNGIRLCRKNGAGDYSVFRVWLPEGGDYDVYVDWEAGKNVLFDFHIGPNGSVAKDPVVGTFLSETSKARSNDKLSENPITLSEGYNYIIFRVSDNFTSGGSSDGWLIPHSVTLVSGDGSGSVLMKTELADFSDGKVNIKAYMSNGTFYDTSKATITYESSDTSVVTVDANGNITEVGSGLSTISARVEIEGIAETVSKEYYITDGGKTVKYNFEQVPSGTADAAVALWYTFENTNGFFEHRATTCKSRMATNGIRLQRKSGKGEYSTFRMWVPESGDYDVYVDWETGKNVLFDVHIGPNGSTTTDKLAGSLRATSAKARSEEKINSEKIYLDQGYNYIIFRVSDDFVNGGSSDGWLIPYSVSLVSGDGQGSVLNGIGINLTGSTASVYGVMSDGEITDDLGDLEISYDTSNKLIATIDENGIITDLGGGDLEISATAEIAGREVTVKSPYTAIRSAYGFDAFYDFGTHLTENGITTGSGTPFSKLSFDATNGFYRFLSGSVSSETTGSMQARNRNLTIHHGRYLALEVFFPVAGTYDMEMWNAATDSGADIHVYLSKDKYSLNAKDKVGTYRCYDPEIVYSQSYFKDIVKTPNVVKNFRIFEPGYYVITFQADGSWLDGKVAGWNYARGSVGSFRLVSGDDANLMGVLPDDGEYISIYPDEKQIEYTDPTVPGTTMLNVATKKFDGTLVDKQYDSLSFASEKEDIATIDPATGLITAIGDGKVQMSATATLNGKTYTGTFDVIAYDNTGVSEAELKVQNELYVREARPAQVVATMNSGNLAYIPADCVKFSASPENIVSIAPDGTVTGVGAGETTICAEVDFRGDKFSVYADVVVEKHSGKTEPTYYTYEKREIAKENIQKYDWAKSEKSSVVNTAEKYVTNYELLYNMAPREGLPRARQVSNVNDSEYYKYCRYCGGDVEGATGGGYGGWNCDPISRPWKIQCPECKRLFPSNDFETLYEYGLDENGVYDAERARRVNAEKVAAGEKDALRNELYPEIGSQRTPENGGEAGVTVTLNNGRGLRPGETVEGWGVDDGWGYRPKDVNGNNYKIATGDIEIHCYIPRYVWQFWDTYQTAIESLGTAYVYTGEEKYGRAGAILLDRFADLIPEYDLNKQYVKDSYRLNNYSTGYIRNNISDVDSFVDIAFMTDALFPMTADSQVQSFLSAKAEQLGLENKKDTREAIWDNWKEGILLELFYNGVKRGRLTGNFGMYQRFAAILAVSLSEEPESSEIIDWIYSAGDSAAAIIVGGNVLPQLVDEICRDGFGTESGDNYLSYWYSYSYQVGEILEEFKTDKKVDLWKHPKFARMFTAFKKKILVNKTLAQVGDSAATASTGMTGDMNAFIDAFMKYKDTDFGKDIAQYIYTKSKFNMDGIHYDIFTKDPESIQKEILNYVTDNPEQKSDLMAGYGFAILRDGESYESAQGATKTNSLRDAWIYFGAAKSHAHYDNLNLGLEAFGLNIAPDNGYPERTGKDANRYQWHNSTISHNTVTVDGKPSTKPKENNGLPMHFDDTSFVKLVDVDANASYDVTDKYRRTLVMVKVNDDISYTMDFFRIKGGDSHIYSFHSQAENAVAVDGLTMTPQQDENGNWVGTYVSNIGPDGKEYVGIDVPYQDKNGSWKDAKGNPYIFSEVGQDPHTIEAWDYETYFPKGFTWLGKVRRDRAPQSEFAVEFEVEDYRKTIADNKGIRLRLTQLNNFTADEVAIAGGMMPRKGANAVLPETFDYLLVKREGENLDSLYTTVLEPYRNTRYIEKIERCNVSGVDSSDPTVSAVKITHTGGKRVDYIVYSEDNTKTFTVDGLFTFRGFVGVYSVNNNGQVINRYVNDGDIISADGSSDMAYGAYTGKVIDFDKEMEFEDFENYIDIEISEKPIDDELLADIKGRWIYIENDGAENAAYEIVDTEKLSDNEVRLHTGNVTNIRGYVDSYNTEKGYVYNFAENDSCRIPLSFIDDSSPIFDSVGALTTSAGSSISVTVKAKSPITVDPPTISYVAQTLPRGASLNTETGTVTWKPDDSQGGDNHFAITARDSDGRESTLHFIVTVYGRTTGKPSTDEEQTTDNSGTSGEGAPSGGGGGGGGGAAPAPDKEDAPVGGGGSDVPQDDDKTGGEENAPDASGETDSIRFTDLGSHSWAADAINELAADGIIKGTTASTFSPASNITRADFALLLVRAFKLTSDNAENFADVTASDYFASELAIARNTGIVGGIGNNKFAPRNPITRQDMMVIVYRALTTQSDENDNADGYASKPSLPKGGGTAEWRWEDTNNGEISSYPDFSTVAPYARDAVSALISAGLVNGKNGKIDPAAYTTRAEVAVLVKRILDYVK